jgi:hypothetical protein
MDETEYCPCCGRGERVFWQPPQMYIDSVTVREAVKADASAIAKNVEDNNPLLAKLKKKHDI